MTTTCGAPARPTVRNATVSQGREDGACLKTHKNTCEHGRTHHAHPSTHAGVHFTSSAFRGSRAARADDTALCHRRRSCARVDGEVHRACRACIARRHRGRAAHYQWLARRLVEVPSQGLPELCAMVVVPSANTTKTRQSARDTDSTRAAVTGGLQAGRAQRTQRARALDELAPKSRSSASRALPVSDSVCRAGSGV